MECSTTAAKRGGHNHAGEHGLVQVADQFFQGEGDGGNGRVEGRGDARRHAHGSHAAVFLGLSRARRASMLLTPAQTCTVGPSRPSDAPEPICRAHRTNLPIVSRTVT
jgi:hypothetical protein